MIPTIFYHPEAFSISGPKLMGRNAAGESFLRGYLKYSKSKEFWIQVEQTDHAKDFSKKVADAGRKEPVRSLSRSSLAGLSKAGTLFYPGPDIGKNAFHRTAHGSNAWSLCGITHTTSSGRAMDAIVELITAPVQKWDALICTSTAVRNNVEKVLQEQINFLEDRLGITKFVMPQFPIIPLGIHTNEFNFSKDQKAACRKSLGASNETVVVLFMGRLSYHAKAHPLAMYQALQRAAKKTGKDIILVECGWHSHESMARLKLREVLFPNLVKPDDDHKLPIPLQRNKDLTKTQGFSQSNESNNKNNKLLSKNKTIYSLFPCTLNDEINQKLTDLTKKLTQEWGERSLNVIELEDRIATAAEKAPSEDKNIILLREAIKLVKSEYDLVVTKEELSVRDAGGLHVIGTERHESRRVDNQLRGRTGRQGDEGSTRFFLSLEDSLLRIFGGDRVAGLMNAFRVEEDMPIESGMLTRSLEGAQKKVETYYYDIRKQVFEYDEVMNNQRKAVYTERRRVIEGKELKKQVLGFGSRTMEEIVEAYVNPDLPPEEWDLNTLVSKVKEFIYLLEDLAPKDLTALNIDELKAFLIEQMSNTYDLKEASIESTHPGMMREAERFFILQQLDNLWREHLQSMDSLRESVGLRGYGQKDPLIEYKNEGYDMFLDMMTNMRRNVIYSMFMFQPASNNKEAETN